jgi:hypothetical protein
VLLTWVTATTIRAVLLLGFTEAPWPVFSINHMALPSIEDHLHINARIRSKAIWAMAEKGMIYR